MGLQRAFKRGRDGGQLRDRSEAIYAGQHDPLLPGLLLDRFSGGTDQFFHCMAFCRVSKLNDAGVSRSAKGLGYEKEIRDYGLNLFGMYGRKVKLSHSEMIEDNKKDLAVNDHGLTCPSTTDCSDRCSDYINPEHKKTIKALQDAGYLK